MTDQTIPQGLDVAKGIGDYGMMAISAAFMLVFAAVILIAGISILKKFFADASNNFAELPEALSKIEANIQETISHYQEISDTNQEIRDYLRTLAEATATQHIGVLKLIVNENFNLSEQRVVAEILRIKEVNHIQDNRKMIECKVKRIVTNLYDKRVSYFHNFCYQGKFIDAFIGDTYIDRVLKVMMSEIYSDHTTTLIMDNVKNLYDELRNDYFKRMLE